MDLNELKELLELISEKDVHEFELEEEGVKLKIKKGVAAHLDASNNHPTDVPLKVNSPVTEQLPSEPEQSTDPGLIMITSPMVGTFYRAPEPAAPVFVNQGDKIKQGQVLCIIEAMKLMNEIESDFAGEIAKKFVANAQPVEYGQPLFAIRTQ